MSSCSSLCSSIRKCTQNPKGVDVFALVSEAIDVIIPRTHKWLIPCHVFFCTLDYRKSCFFIDGKILFGHQCRRQETARGEGEFSSILADRRSSCSKNEHANQSCRKQLTSRFSMLCYRRTRGYTSSWDEGLIDRSFVLPFEFRSPKTGFLSYPNLLNYVLLARGSS